VTFELIRLRFHFRAAESLCFPPGKAGNVLRGAFGIMLRETAAAPEYARIFEPKAAGPSGLADAPRPFVFRAAHLDGLTISPGSEFHFDVHLFDTRSDVRKHFVTAFAHWRPRAESISVEEEAVAIELNGLAECAARIQVQFLTPTELKPAQPEFAVLFARLRDRISTLRALYGAGSLDIDFRAMGERAAAVRMTRCELNWTEVERRSSRTGQTHPLGGFTGATEYDGDLGEFLPYLRAGQWTGVGRQTVWGKGEICFQVCF
jgi:hypothetical protein